MTKNNHQTTERPAHRELVLIEGSLGGGDKSLEKLKRAGFSVQAFHWRNDMKVLLPGLASDTGSRMTQRGYVGNLPAFVDRKTLRDKAEIMNILTKSRDILNPPGLLDIKLGPSDSVRREIRRLLPAEKQLAALQPPSQILYWCANTSKIKINTGIQRVVRNLAVGLQRRGVDLIPVRMDEHGEISALTEMDYTNLAAFNGPVWPEPPSLPSNLAGLWLIVPEITHFNSANQNAISLAKRLGMKVAVIVFDLIPLKLPHVRREIGAGPGFDKYCASLSAADASFPISWVTSFDVAEYLSQQRLHAPPIYPCQLPSEFLDIERQQAPRPGPAPGEPLKLLAVGSWSIRKNYVALLQALAKAQQLARRKIHLTIAGSRPKNSPVVDSIEEAAAKAMNVELRSFISEEELQRLLASCHAQVYPTFAEGFGLPVVESVWHALPCLCHDKSSLAEVAPGGGVLTVDMLDVNAIASALCRLADEDGLLERLSREATGRPARTWAEYAEDIHLGLARFSQECGPLPQA